MGIIAIIAWELIVVGCMMIGSNHPLLFKVKRYLFGTLTLMGGLLFTFYIGWEGESIFWRMLMGDAMWFGLLIWMIFDHKKHTYRMVKIAPREYTITTTIKELEDEIRVKRQFKYQEKLYSMRGLPLPVRDNRSELLVCFEQIRGVDYEIAHILKTDIPITMPQLLEKIWDKLVVLIWLLMPFFIYLQNLEVMEEPLLGCVFILLFSHFFVKLGKGERGGALSVMRKVAIVFEVIGWGFLIYTLIDLFRLY